MVPSGTEYLAGLLAVTASASNAAQDGHPDRASRDTARAPLKAGPPKEGGRVFGSLDEYLVYLRDYAAPMDQPWYREVRPGVYRLETGNLRSDAPPRHFTREDLERRFGFRR